MNDAKRNDPLSVACELVGRFQYHFSKIEKALDAGITKVFSLNDGASTVLVANIDFKKKADVVKAMAALQFKDDGSLDKLLSEILGINSSHRQTVIHSTFEPHDAGAVKFVRVSCDAPLRNDERNDPARSVARLVFSERTDQPVTSIPFTAPA